MNLFEFQLLKHSATGQSFLGDSSDLQAALHDLTGSFLVLIKGVCIDILRFRAKRESSSIPLRLLSKSQSRCWIAILCFLRTSVQRGLLLCCRAHTRRLGKKPHTAVTRASRRRTVPAVEVCKDANRSRRYPLTLLLRQTPEPLVGAALRKNAEISLCNFQRPL